jgi:cytochrome c
LVGPSFKEIAKRYGNIDSAETFLPKKIIQGGTGNWPGNIAMPANPSLKETEAEEITKFILGLSLSPRN